MTTHADRDASKLATHPCDGCGTQTAKRVCSSCWGTTDDPMWCKACNGVCRQTPSCSPMRTQPAPVDTAEIRARAHHNALTDGRRGRQPWATLTDDVPALCDEVDRLRAEAERWKEKAQESGAAYANANTKHHAELDLRLKAEADLRRLRKGGA